MFAGKHFQNAYVCDDIDEAIATFRAAGLAKEPRVLHSTDTVDTPDGPKAMELKVAIIRLAGLTYELIQPVRDETGVYANAPANGGKVRFHHTCCRVDDWAAFREEAARSGVPLAMERDYGEGQVKYAYFDARDTLGHYVEFMWMPEDQFRS